MIADFGSTSPFANRLNGLLFFVLPFRISVNSLDGVGNDPLYLPGARPYCFKDTVRNRFKVPSTTCSL